MVLKIHHGGDSEILNYEYDRNNEKYSDYDFTSDCADDKNQDEEDSIEELFLMLNELEKKSAVNDEYHLIDEKLFYLKTRDAQAVKRVIKNHSEVIAPSFKDVRPSTVPVTHRFELTSDNPMYQKPRRISRSYNEIVRKETDRMISACIITAVESSSKSPVVIPTKKEV